MAKNGVTKIRINSPGVLALLQGPEVTADVTRRANAIKSALPTDNGEEWAVEVSVGRDRAGAIVLPTNRAARLSVAENNSIIRNLSAGR